MTDTTDRVAKPTEVLRDAGYSNVVAMIQRDGNLSLDSDSRADLDRAVGYLCSGGAAIVEQPNTDTDGISWATLSLPAS